MEHKRTPGNWFVAHDSRGFAVETERVRIVNLGHSDECAEADAYLMAAAPAMLAALEYAQKFERNRGGSWAEFKAIIDGAVATAVRHNHPNRGPKGPSANPAPSEIRAAREAAGLSQTGAAALIHCTLRGWQEWEAGNRKMHPAFWELFRIKSAL